VNPHTVKNKIKERKDYKMTDVSENYLSSTRVLSTEENNFSVQFFQPICLKG